MAGGSFCCPVWDNGRSGRHGYGMTASGLGEEAGTRAEAAPVAELREVSRVYHLDRGYESIEERLARLGAKIRRIEDN